jgi:hypothetical protein
MFGIKKGTSACMGELLVRIKRELRVRTEVKT